MTKHNYFTGLLSLLMVIVMQSISAQRTGNIVEIFGRERTETTREGTIIHQAEEGLALRNAMRPGMLTGIQDILFWQIATGNFERPRAGGELAHNYLNNPQPLMWEVIRTDSTGFFRDNLGRAYVYTEFESPVDAIALLEATGHTRVFINGMPQEGDHYDYAHTLIPFKLQEGLNQFIYTYGRFGRVRSRVVIPSKELQFSLRDLTLPSIIRGEQDEKWGAVRLINASEKTQQGLRITCIFPDGETAMYQTGNVAPMSVRKVQFKIPALQGDWHSDTLQATLILSDASGHEIDRSLVPINVHNAGQHHERTFISNIDGSVQYFSVAPSTSEAPNQALVLTLHGASVEAYGQIRCYKQKDWAHIVAPTNRRPFGFNWEEWGQLDALEVLHQSRLLFHTDTSRTYLTGHSMGGHGSWFLGATYPDKWAAIAPAAGYADIIGYRRTGTDSLMRDNPHFAMIYRGALTGRTVDLAHNYLQSGIYVLHGDADDVVPVKFARQMRNILSDFHPNFTYYEYPGGTHWDGCHSMDWPPLFDFLRQNSIPPIHEVRNLEFITASPAVSASNYWVTINQQILPYQHSRVKANLDNDTLRVTTENIAHLTLNLQQLKLQHENILILIDGQPISAVTTTATSLRNDGYVWLQSLALSYREKNPERYGGFKLAFTNHVVLVYGTRGSKEENQWYRNKALFDAATFLYLANGSFEVISDREFNPEKYKDRNVILYGNAQTNRAWRMLLAESPVQVTRRGIQFGDTFLEGDNLGTFFIYPRPDSHIASVGVVAGTGIKGMKSTFPNDYFSGITGFPDLLIFDVDWIRDGTEGIKVSGFFGNDWSVTNGDFVVYPGN